MGVIRKLGVLVLVAAASYGAWHGARALVTEYRAYRAMQQATAAMWNYLNEPVGTRDTPEGPQPVNRADWLAEVGRRAAHAPR